jgi:quercetin dioxygenase-like cupin family protein
MTTETSTTSARSEDAIMGQGRGDHEDPVHRVSYSFRRDGGDLWVYTWLEDGADLPEHFHPSLTEYWESLEGTARVRLDGKWRELRPEDGPVTVATNVRHQLANSSGATVRMRTRVTPAGRLEEFLIESARAAREGLYNAHNLPRGIRGARWLANFALRFRDETVMTSPPPALQRVMLPLFAKLLPERG